MTSQPNTPTTPLASQNGKVSGGVVILNGIGNHYTEWTGFYYWVLPIPWDKKIFKKCILELIEVEKEALGQDYSMAQHERQAKIPHWEFGIQSQTDHSKLGRLIGSHLQNTKGYLSSYFSNIHNPLQLPSENLPIRLTFPWTSKREWTPIQDTKDIALALTLENAILQEIEKL